MNKQDYEKVISLGKTALELMELIELDVLAVVKVVRWIDNEVNNKMDPTQHLALLHILDNHMRFLKIGGENNAR